MSATARLKQTLFMIFALALVTLGFVGTTPVAQATGDEPCVETDDQVVTEWFETDPGAPWVATGASRVKTEGTDPTYTAWVNDGEPVRTETNAPPSADSDLVQYVSAGTVDDSTDGHWDDTDVTFYTWTGGNSDSAPPVYADASQTSLHPDWNATNGNPQGGPHASASLYSPYEAGNGPRTASWFLKAGTFVPGVQDTDYLWQKQVRTLVPGTDDVIEYEYTKTIEGVDCPPDEEICPDGTDHAGEAYPVAGDAESCDEEQQEGGICPEGTDHAGEAFPVAGDAESCDDEDKPWICHPVEGKGELGNGWNLIDPNQASSHIDEALFPDGEYWKHETRDGRHDIYSEDGETCPGEPVEICPDGTDHAGEAYPVAGDVESCDDDEEICPDGTEHAGEEYPVAGDVESCDEEQQEGGICPDGTDHDGEPFPVDGDPESCDEDDDEEVCPKGTDKAGQEIPSGKNAEKFCDDDLVIGPGPGNNPGNNPGSNPQGSNQPSPGVTPATAPGADVPSSVAAGLAPSQRDLTRSGGGAGLLGIGVALLGAALVGVSLRPRRRIGARFSAAN